MFETKGSEAKWKPIHRFLQGLGVDETVGYERLSEVAGHDVRVDRSALYEAIKQLELHDHRTAENVRNVGYRIIEAKEHHKVGLKHQLKAKRSVRRGVRKLRAADRSRLTAEEKQKIDTLSTKLAKHETMLINHDSRIRTLEKAATKTSVQMSQVQRKQAELEQALRAAGISVRDKTAGSA